MNWDLYKNLLEVKGATKQDRLINETKTSILKRAQNSPAYKSVLINNQIQNVVITSGGSLIEKKINALPNENIYAGSPVVWNNRQWIITYTDCEDSIYQRGLMNQCNTCLKWQNENGDIIVRYGYSQDITEFAAGVVENKILNSLQFGVKVKIPVDEETVKLQRGKRFLLDVINIQPSAYILTNKNTVTENFLPENITEEYVFDGLGKVLLITLTQTQRSDDDNFDLMIADYFIPEITPPIIIGSSCAITCSEKFEIKTGGNAKTFKAVFYDTDKNIISGIVPVWNVITLPEYENMFSIEYINSDVKITAPNNAKLIGTQIKIELTNDTEQYYTSQNVKVVSIFG